MKGSQELSKGSQKRGSQKVPRSFERFPGASKAPRSFERFAGAFRRLLEASKGSEELPEGSQKL